jgi:flagellar assembly protein FliH
MQTQQPAKPRAVKFTFDTVFSEAAQAVQPGQRTRSSYSSDEVERIRNETFAAAKADAEVQVSALKADAMANIGAGMASLFEQLDATTKTLREESVQLALAVARKLAEASLNAFPLRHVEDILTDCLHKLHREPRLVVRVPAQMSEALQAEVHALADRHGFAGRVVVLPEPSLAGADCRVEWAGGGLERDLSISLAAIEETVGRWRSLIETEK